MPSIHPFRTFLAGALALSASLLPQPAASQQQLPVAEIERIVREYLMREPQVIYDAIQELQKRREAEQAVRQKEMISQRQGELFNAPGDPVAGNPAGDVTIVEFFDYRCSYCRSMSNGLRALIGHDPKLRFVFKELPVLGPDSVTAAKIALAASRLAPEKYPPLHFALMQSRDLSEEAVLGLAAQHGYDRAALAAEMEKDWIQQRIDANMKLANDLGIEGTPSFVVGDRLIPGATDVANLATIVSEQRQKAN